MSAIALRSEEQVGLGVAVIAHAALIALLVLLAQRKHMVISLPERMVVSLAEDVSLKSAAPQPAPEAQAAVAPTLAEKPTPKLVSKTPEVKKPLPTQAPPPMQRSTTREQPKPQPKNDASGGSRIGANFLQGQGASQASNAPVAAAEIGADVQASLKQAIDRQLRRYWQPPSGVDADQLRTYLAFNLNPDGSLAGPPRFIRQTGVDESNRAQAGRHIELAMRAVELAAPFDLPPKYYNAWKRINNWEFKWTPPQ